MLGSQIQFTTLDLKVSVFLKHFIYVRGCFACMCVSVYYMLAWDLQIPEERIKNLGDRYTVLVHLGLSV